MSLLVSEIFHSIQGESLDAGRPCTFVRLTGCNLRCTYCDTTYAYGQGEEMDFRAILERIGTFGCSLIGITGGEPLLQEETPLLIQRLLDTGREVLVETNGSLDIGRIDDQCVRIVDMKCPSSGEVERNDFGNLGRLTTRDQLKFVIGNREDYMYARGILDRVDPSYPPDHVLLSPVFGKMEPSTLAEWILADHLDARLHLQLHKVIWPGIDRGV